MQPATGPEQRKHLRAACGLVCALTVAASFSCAAWADGRAPGTKFVIPAGKEAAVRALLAPLRLEAAVAEGYVLANIRIAFDHVVLELRSAAQPAPVTLQVRYPREAFPQDKPAGLLALRPGAGVPEAVVASVVAALSRRTAAELPWLALAPSPPRAQESAVLPGEAAKTPGATASASGGTPSAAAPVAPAQVPATPASDWPWWVVFAVIVGGLAFERIAAARARRRPLTPEG